MAGIGEKKAITIKLTTDMLGTVAKDPEVYKTYIQSKAPVDTSDTDD